MQVCWEFVHHPENNFPVRKCVCSWGNNFDLEAMSDFPAAAKLFEQKHTHKTLKHKNLLAKNNQYLSCCWCPCGCTYCEKKMVWFHVDAPVVTNCMNQRGLSFVLTSVPRANFLIIPARGTQTMYMQIFVLLSNWSYAIAGKWSLQ